MADVPSIKATGFQGAADDIARLLAEKRISRSALEARLPEADRAFLDRQLAASSWVPIATYVRVAAILGELEGRGDVPGYFRARGRRAAERLHKAGVYRQFDASVETWGKRAGSIATTMSSVLYNFTKWTFEAMPDRGGFEIRIDGAREFPDALRWVGEGFIEYVSQHQSGKKKVEVTSERTSPDRIVYTVQVA
jgi:hypothetical protein